MAGSRAVTGARQVSNWNIANAMTGARVLTLPPYVWAIDQGHVQWAMLMVVICGGLDVFDGKVAKLLGCTTAFGEMFDAIMDAFCYGFIMIVLVAYGWLPWPPIAIMVALGVVNTVMRARYLKRAGRTVNYRSWAMEKIVAYVGYLCGFGTAQIEVDFYSWTCAALMAIVMAHDTKRMLWDPVDPVEEPVGAPAAAAAAPAASLAEASR